MNYYQYFAALVLLMALPAAANAQSPLIITVVTKGSFTEAGKSIIGKAYEKIGVAIEFEEYPGERALISTNDGKTDGELFRIAGLHKKYLNLIQIPVSYIPDEIAVFSKLNFKVSGWQSLKPYTVGVRIGDKFVEDNTRDMERYFVTQDLQSFKMLAINRIQVAVVSRWDGLEHINTVGSRTIKPLSPSIVINPLYHYVHRKHGKIVPLLTSAIQSMHKDGTIKRILKEAEASLLQ